MDNEKSDRLRSMLQEALLPLTKKMDTLEEEIIALKKEQRDLIKTLENQNK